MTRSSRSFPLFNLLVLILSQLLLVCSAQAQVKASLVSANRSVQPGKMFEVALRLEHQEHWHTYWKNPGTGLPTTLKWTLPEGFVAGDIQWPTPKRITDSTGAVSGYGYEGDLLLVVQIFPTTQPKPGETVTLKARADWLMCKEACVPGKAELELSLPVATGKAELDPAWTERFASATKSLPYFRAGWGISTRLKGNTVVMSIIPNEHSLVREPSDLYFYCEDGFIQYDAPQTLKTNGTKGFLLTLPITPDFGAPPPRIRGVLASSTDWNNQEPGSGFTVEAPLLAETTELAPSSGDAPPAAAAQGLGATLLLALVGGLILNLMPCVFPVLGIKILGFVQQAGSDRRKVVLHGLVFTAGVLLSFWTLAGLLALLRAGGTQLGWGFQLQSPGFVYLLAMLMLVFALNMSGLFEFGLGATGLGAGLQMKEGYAGSFFTGILATVVATPCSAPFLAPALGAALALPPLASFSVFTAIGVGLSTPYLLLSLFPSAVKVLPRPGAWMEGFKQFMAFPLYGTVGYLLWVLAGQVEDNALLAAFLGAVFVAMGTWLYGRWNAPGAKPGRARAGLALGLLISGAGLWAGWPASEKASDAPVWEPWSAQRVETLRKEGRLIYVDFTARWCATCQANKKLVFGSAELRRTFADRKVALLKADWTNRDPSITAELARWNRSAVPFNLIYQPGKAEPVILPELLTAETVLKALEPAP